MGEKIKDKLDDNFIINEFYRSGYILLDQYKNARTKMELVDQDGYKYLASYGAFDYRRKKNIQLSRFGNGNPFSLDNVSLFLSKYFPNVHLEKDQKWIGVNKNLNFYDDDGYKYNISFSNIQSGYKRGSILERFGKSNCYAKYNINIYLNNKNSRYQLFDDTEYSGVLEKMIFKDLDGFMYFTNFANVKDSIERNYFLAKVDMKNLYSLDNIENWIKIENKPFKLINGQEYISCSSKLKFKCLNCRDDEIPFTSNWISIIANHGCGICAGSQVGKYNSLFYKNNKICEYWDFEKNYPIEPKDIVCGSNKFYYWKCENCKISYLASPNSRFHIQKSYCKKCTRLFSNGAKNIFIFLEKYKNNKKINFEIEHTFKNCKYIHPLHFDFIIWDYFDKNKYMLVEYQGEGHFVPVDFAGKGIKWAELTFEKNKIRDNIKRDYCKNNNIKLIEIPYWDFNNIESILTKELHLNLNL
jgi:hypothetical protein